MVIDVLERDDLPFPRSLPEFRELFPDEAALQFPLFAIAPAASHPTLRLSVSAGRVLVVCRR